MTQKNVFYFQLQQENKNVPGVKGRREEGEKSKMVAGGARREELAEAGYGAISDESQVCR